MRSKNAYPMLTSAVVANRLNEVAEDTSNIMVCPPLISRVRNGKPGGLVEVSIAVKAWACLAEENIKGHPFIEHEHDTI